MIHQIQEKKTLIEFPNHIEENRKMVETQDKPGQSSEMKGKSTTVEINRLEATKSVVHINTVKGNLQPKDVPRRTTENALNEN